jgi:hypothetical protein
MAAPGMILINSAASRPLSEMFSTMALVERLAGLPGIDRHHYVGGNNLDFRLLVWTCRTIVGRRKVRPLRQDDTRFFEVRKPVALTVTV